MSTNDANSLPNEDDDDTTKCRTRLAIIELHGDYGIESLRRDAGFGLPGSRRISSCSAATNGVCSESGLLTNSEYAPCASAAKQPDAREHRRGLWADPNSMPLWE